ncbi:Retrovirus-related Pol polyprotein LINE-1 [Gossypium australe]|uniref:Retrovirus-related Pol polyprotein LINE-1 n=1 Tax=Gossypium australe TaxID=47621 RepID=A0A5B6VTR5_9ROSI|nr:Retrovirus-related Pol polyprotein LINE-1 [Gossypium australe]
MRVRWCTRLCGKNKVVEFFERLYGEVPTNLRNIPKNGFPCIESSEITFLEAVISNEEIKKALFDMTPLKAPRSDEYYALFFQSQWDTLGNNVCQWVKSVFEGSPIEPELNNTLIVLIPQKGSPEDFSQFRPIILCFVLYKLVMKVITNRFKVIFPRLISQEQAGFIAGRNIFDNIILAQEVIHSMRCNQKGRKWMAVKLDLEKAYDRVSWDFINASLIAARIPFFLRNVVMSVISSSTMQVLWNGVPTQKFKPNRGIRQGCPLSPYLFVLCMEWLGHFIHSRMEASTWDPIRLSRSGPSVSHLFFADDLVIFCKVEIDQARLLESVITLFCQIFGHKISEQVFTLMEVPLKDMASYSRELNMVYRGWGQRLMLEKPLDSREMVNIDGSWNLDLFRVWVSEEVINRITSIPPPHPDSGADRVIWARSSTGIFSVRSAYWSMQKDQWHPHDEYWKIPWKYQDGAVNSNPGAAAAGVVARDHAGNWIMGFNRFLGNCTPIEAEIWGIMDGILILLNKGYRQIIIVSDNLEVVQNLSALDSEDSGIAVLRRTQQAPKEILDLLQADKANGYFM